MSPKKCSLIFLLGVVFIVAALGGSAVQGFDLPVATSGFEEWVGVVAKVLAHGDKSKEETFQALKAFQTTAMNHLRKQGEVFKNAEHGDIAPLIRKVLQSKTIIESPVFFRVRPALFQGGAAAFAFDITGVYFQPCAVIAAASGVVIRPSGIIISPEVLFVAPWGVNINPLALNISPTVLMVAPFDTTVAGQGLNIAPALIAIAPIRTVVSSVGPLAIYDTLISKVVPAIPDPPSAGPQPPRLVPPVPPNVSSFISKLLPADAANLISKLLPTWTNP